MAIGTFVGTVIVIGAYELSKKLTKEVIIPVCRGIKLGIQDAREEMKKEKEKSKKAECEVASGNDSVAIKEPANDVESEKNGENSNTGGG